MPLEGMDWLSGRSNSCMHEGTGRRKQWRIRPTGRGPNRWSMEIKVYTSLCREDGHTKEGMWHAWIGDVDDSQETRKIASSLAKKAMKLAMDGKLTVLIYMGYNDDKEDTKAQLSRLVEEILRDTVHAGRLETLFVRITDGWKTSDSAWMFWSNTCCQIMRWLRLWQHL